MRFYRLALALLLLVISLLIVVRLLGARNSSPLASLFTNPDSSPCKLPCLFGVRVGEMTVDNAIKLIETHPVARDFQLDSGGRTIKPGKAAKSPIMLVEGTGDGLVRMVNLTSSRWFYNIPDDPNELALPMAASIGDFISLFGAPDNLQTTYWDSGRLNYVWVRLEPKVALGIGILLPGAARGSEGRLDSHHPMAYLILSDDDCAPDDRSLLGHTWQSWYGFITRDRYGHHAQVPFYTVKTSTGSIPCRDVPQQHTP